MLSNKYNYQDEEPIIKKVKKTREKKVKEDKTKFEWITELKNLKHIEEKPEKYIENLKMDKIKKELIYA